MIVRQWVECSQEVEVNISGEDAARVICEAEERCANPATPIVYRASLMRQMIGYLATTLRKLPDELVEQCPLSARNLIADFFLEQEKRFRFPLSQVEISAQDVQLPVDTAGEKV